MKDELMSALDVTDNATLDRLQRRLVEDAARDGLLDIAYRTIDTPVGSLLIASTEQGIVRIAFAVQGHEQALEQLAEKISPRVLHAPSRLDSAVRQLDDYFAGRRTAFDLPVDLRLATGFRRSVLEHLPEIGYGHTESYRDVATATGSPAAVRAVGTACALNPVPIVVPCHRVVRTDGSWGQYAGGVEAKSALLTLEAA